MNDIRFGYQIMNSTEAPMNVPLPQTSWFPNHEEAVRAARAAVDAYRLSIPETFASRPRRTTEGEADDPFWGEGQTVTSIGFNCPLRGFAALLVVPQDRWSE